MSATLTIAKQVDVFDSTVPDLQTLIDALGTLGLDQKIIILEANSDGVLQLASALAGESGWVAIHLFSHGSVDSLQWGSTFLNQSNLFDYSAALAEIGNALTDSGDLLLYDCDVAQGDVGLQFIDSLAQYTGADMAASINATGGESLGGDWVLGAKTGEITSNYLSGEGYPGPC